MSRFMSLDAQMQSLHDAEFIPGEAPLATISFPPSLLDMMQELSHARTLDSIIGLVRERARTLAGADGVSFVLKDGEFCHYVDEDAIGPLWKGRKFPLATCISGIAMRERRVLVIEDVYDDPRVPIDAYRVTFVKSMAMVPIRLSNPIGGIGFYWATHHRPSKADLVVLQAIADSVSIAMENVSLYAELKSKVRALEESNHELSRFAWVASHDLQEPLRTITTQVELLSRRYSEKLDERGKHYIENATSSAKRLQNLVQDLLVHSRVEHSEHFKPIMLSEVIREVLADMHVLISESGAQINYGELPWVWCERVMIGRLFQNLLSNAIKFRKPDVAPLIQLSCVREDGSWHFTLADNGIGIEPEQSERVFGLFQRVHAQSVFPGSGIGLATCKKIAELHQGRIWVESTLGEGSIFHVILPLMGEEVSMEGIR